MFPESSEPCARSGPARLVENVKGLLRESFAKYFEYIYLQLSYPEVCLKSDESWQDHLARLGSTTPRAPSRACTTGWSTAF